MKVTLTTFSLIDGSPRKEEIEVEDENIAKKIQWIEDQRLALRQTVISGDKQPLFDLYHDNKYCTRFLGGCSGCKLLKSGCVYLIAMAC